MIRQLRYVNSRGDEIAFGGCSAPWRFGRLDIFDTMQAHRSTGGRITSFAGEIRELSMAVYMREGSLEERNRFADVLDYDVRTGQPGTLWAGGSWMRCWIPDRKVTGWEHYDSAADYECTVLSDRPVWVRQEEIVLTAVEPTDDAGLNYPHGYPHNYAYSAGASARVRNPFMLPCRCDIAFPGPCRDPYVIIGGNRYQVRADVQAGQLLLIRGFGDKGIVLRHSDGIQRNVFASGVREDGADPFAEVPVGSLVAAWSGAYNVSVTLYEERTTPWLE